jgi:hypothetical protein
MAFLPAETLDLGHSDSLNANFCERLPNVVELEGLDDGRNKFHAIGPPGPA